MTVAIEQWKRLAAERAAEFLDGVRVLGLGTGSTAAAFVDVVGERLAAGQIGGFVAVPTSMETARRAADRGIPLADLDTHPRLDLTVDGADEVSPELDLIKGLGGALTREKIVATASRELIIIADDSKLVSRLGDVAPLPVEVLPFGRHTVELSLRELGADPLLRLRDGQPVATDQENHILDCRFGAMPDDLAELATAIDVIPGVVAHGFFLGMADRVIVAGAGGVRILERS